MTNLIMVVCDRYRLTEQTLRTLYQNTPNNQYNLTIMDNGSTDFRMLKLYEKVQAANVAIIGIERPTGYVGKARNLGACWSEQVFGRGQYICFIDNDLYFHPQWLEKMEEEMGYWQPVTTPVILGGHQHPYHHMNNSAANHVYVDAVAGYSMMMRWSVWEYFGPFISDGTGPGQSEDTDLCHRVKQEGGVCAYIHPPVLEHCGITNSKGEPATGAEHFRRVEGVLYE